MNVVPCPHNSLLALCPLCTPLENPKAGAGKTKAPVTCIPTYVVGALGIGMLEGELKYGRHNYRDIPVKASEYIDAARRHLDDWWEGVDNDTESAANLSNLVKAMACLTVLRDAQMQGKLIDDRPPGSAHVRMRTTLNEMAAKLREKYPSPPPPHTRFK